MIRNQTTKKKNEKKKEKQKIIFEESSTRPHLSQQAGRRLVIFTHPRKTQTETHRVHMSTRNLGRGPDDSRTRLIIIIIIIIITRGSHGRR